MKRSRSGFYLHTLCNKLLPALLILSIGRLSSCTPALYVPAEGQATQAASLNDLRLGRQLYVSKCGSCHTLYLPEKYKKEQWRDLLDKMSHKVALDSTEKALILKYVNKGH